MVRKRRSVYIVLAAVLAVLIAIVLMLDGILKTAVNTIVPQITKTEVSVDEVSVGLFSGDFYIGGVNISNPKGFSDSSVFVLKKIDVDLQPTSLFKDVIVIDKIEVDGAEFFYEIKGATSNVSTLMNNINSFMGDTKKATKVDKAKKAGDADVASKKVFVKEFAFTNGKVSIGAGFTKQATAITLNVPDLTLRNIGSENKGVTIAEVVAQGLAAFSASAVTVVASDGAKNLLNGGTSVMDKLKGLFQ